MELTLPQKPRGKRKTRSDQPKMLTDDAINDDYTDINTIHNNSRRPERRIRQLSLEKYDQPKCQTAARSPLESDLHTISQGLINCEFFPSEVIYSFS
jgi:hypothetical protein